MPMTSAPPVRARSAPLLQVASRQRWRRARGVAALTCLSLVFGLGATNTCGLTSFERTYPFGDWNEAWAIRQTADQGFVMTGITGGWLDDGSDDDAYLVKTDRFGNLEWQVGLGGSDLEEGASIALAPDGGYLIGGSSVVNGGSASSYLVKVDANGGEVWHKTFEPASFVSIVTSIEPTSDGGYILGATTNGAGYYGYLMKTNGSGDPVWKRTVGAQILAVQPLADGGFVGLGSALVSNPSPNLVERVVLVRTNAAGTVLWQKLVGYGVPVSLALEPDGGFLVAGMSRAFGPGDYDAYWLKLDSSGGPVWERHFDSAGWSERGVAVGRAPEGGYFVLASTHAPAPAVGDHPLLLKTDTLGNVEWSRTYGDGTTMPWAGIRAAGGGYVFAGEKHNDGSYDSAFLLEVASDGSG